MEFDFESENWGDFETTRDAFLDALIAWSAERSPVNALLRPHVAHFLLWHRGYLQRPLRTLNRDDLAEFLLGWVPRKYLADPDEAPELCRSIETMIEYLATTDALDHGFERAASLISFVSEIGDEVAEAMGEETNFGMSKSLLSAPLTGPDGKSLPDLGELLDNDDLSLEEVQALLDVRMAAFNELPFEERKRLTDSPVHRGEPIPLPFTYVPPHPGEVEATAAFADIVRMVDGFVAYADAHGGIPLTKAGNIKVRDAAAIVTELAIDGDLQFVENPEFSMTTSLDLRWLTLVDDLATAAGAVERLTTKLRPNPEWLPLSATEKATELADLILAGGFLSSEGTGPEWLGELRQLLDDGVPHWLNPGLVEGNRIPVDQIVDLAIEVAAMQPGSRRAMIGADVFDDWVTSMVGELLAGLVRFGLLIWHDAEHRPNHFGNRDIPVGGELSLTALGRHVLPRHVEEAGYSFDSISGIEEASVDQLIDLAWSGGLTGPEVVARWRVEETVAERAQAIADHLIDSDSFDRLVAFDVFQALDDPATIGPIVRRLLDSPAASYAAGYLLDHDLASPADVAGFVDLTPLVDMLSAMSGDSEGFDAMFRQAVEDIDGDLIDELWHHDQPETIIVLEAAGKHVSDKRLAKAARTAATKHRSWLANQGR